MTAVTPPARPRRGGTGSTRSPAAGSGSGSASPTDPAPATCGQPPRRRRTGPLRSSLPAATPGLAEPLTGRELEVLRLLAAGRSNQRIGHDLVVALDTVKST